MAELYAEGGNYRIELEHRAAYCRVWTRRDVDSETGAGYARDKIQHFEALARGPADSMILDLIDAPPVAGPKTQGAIGEMLGAWESARRPIALVAGNDKVQALQLKRLAAQHAPRFCCVFVGLEAARDWMRQLGHGT